MCNSSAEGLTHLAPELTQLEETMVAVACGLEHEDESDQSVEAAQPEEQEIQNLVTEDFKKFIISVSVEVSPQTREDYVRLSRKFSDWCRNKKLIKEHEDIFETVPVETPFLIIHWIMETCDTINPDKEEKPATQSRASYSTAEKMRAALAHTFGRPTYRGTQPWDENAATGNPTTSTIISRYMTALKRRKFESGEQSMSSRALTSDVIKKIWLYNRQPAIAGLVYPIPTVQRRQARGGYPARVLLHAVITLGFVCLMRIDEVLSLRTEDIEERDDGGLQITLASRKTDPFGGTKPFVLFGFDSDEEHLCPLTALAEWLVLSGVKEGYIFRKVNSSGQASLTDDPLTQATFLEMLRHSLYDIGLHGHLYGCHSCRRGGTQWLAKVHRWSIQRICDWGGWSKNHSHLTVVKYLFSWVDDANEPRESFFSPLRQVTSNCPRCGRNCPC